MDIKENSEIRLDVKVSEQLGISREKAKELVTSGCVFVNGKKIVKASNKIKADDEIFVEKNEVLKYVSRGGFKLEHALDVFEIDVNGKDCIDAGASTGGFTDCLLQHGAKSVLCVDTGTDQLKDTIKDNEKVTALEQTNINDISHEPVDFVCCDVSFVSTVKVIHKINELLKNNGVAVILIKPQFEVGRNNINKNGIVKNVKITKSTVDNLIVFYNSAGFSTDQLVRSPITGGDGNVEYLIKLVKEENPINKITSKDMNNIFV